MKRTPPYSSVRPVRSVWSSQSGHRPQFFLSFQDDRHYVRLKLIALALLFFLAAALEIP